jgi:hypothetical protein
LRCERYQRAQLRRERGLAATTTLLALVTIRVAWWGWSAKLDAERQRAAAEESAAIAQQQRAASTAYCTSLETLLNSVEKHPGNAQLQRDLSISQQRIGATLMDQGDMTGAIAQYRAALQINRASDLASKQRFTRS